MKKIILAAVMALLAVGASAQKPSEALLWPNGAPLKSSNPADTAKVFIYLPDADKATGRAVVICPGGGYSHLAIDHEGKDWAGFFNHLGIAVVVLKYRMPHGNFNVPIADAEEAVKMVRRNAKPWHVNPQDVGIMGSSAGGHLASTVATHAPDEARPDFQILFYPVVTMEPHFTHRGSHDNFFGNKHGADELKALERLYSGEMQVTQKTPRAWIALSNDDNVVPAINGTAYYLSLNRLQIPASLHVYPTGGHGWGSRIGFKHHVEMMAELKAWLQSF